MRKRIETDQNGNEREVVVFEGTVKSISDEMISYGNNGKHGCAATVEFETPDGKTVTRSAFIREGNLQHGIDVGDRKLCTASPTEGGSFIITVSHLTYGGERATVDDFGEFGMAAIVSQPVDATV